MPADEVAPLDAYVTAKPAEPTFTLQGGDPLAAPLVETWADFARMQAGVLSSEAATAAFMRLCVAAKNNKPDNDRDTEALLIRATAAEEVSWNMQAYFKGQNFAETVHDTGPDEKARIDLHDYRVHAASRLRNAEGELVEIRGNLKALGFENEPVYRVLEEAFSLLRSVADDIEPRRMMKA